MKKLDEKSHDDVYNPNRPRVARTLEHEVAYEFDGNIVKTVHIITRHNCGGGYIGFLHIQKVGLGASLESLHFLDGKLSKYALQSTDDEPFLSSTEYDFEPYEGRSSLSEEFCEKFGKEFKPVFETDVKLKEFISTHFTILLPYLK